MEVNQERAKRVKYTWCWFAKLITSFLDKIPALEASRDVQENFSSTHGPAWLCPVPIPGQRGRALCPSLQPLQVASPDSLISCLFMHWVRDTTRFSSSFACRSVSCSVVTLWLGVLGR